MMKRASTLIPPSLSDKDSLKRRSKTSNRSTRDELENKIDVEQHKRVVVNNPYILSSATKNKKDKQTAVDNMTTGLLTTSKKKELIKHQQPPSKDRTLTDVINWRVINHKNLMSNTTSTSTMANCQMDDAEVRKQRCKPNTHALFYTKFVRFGEEFTYIIHILLLILALPLKVMGTFFKAT